MAAVQQLHRRGELVVMSDFNHIPTGDPDNPVLEWRAAAKALAPESTGEPLYDLGLSSLEFPLNDREVTMLHKLLDSNRAALIHADAAGRKTGRPEWDIHFKEPVILMPLPDLNQQRRVASLLEAAALDAHHRGTDSEAAARLQQLLALERAMYRQPGLVGHLVGVGIGAMACDVLRKIAPDLRVGSSQGSSQPASIDQVRRLIDSLLDETAQRDGQRYAFQYERMNLLETTIQFAHGNFNFAGSTGSISSGRPIGGYLMSPVIYADGAKILDIIAKVVDAAQSPTGRPPRRGSI